MPISSTKRKRNLEDTYDKALSRCTYLVNNKNNNYYNEMWMFAIVERGPTAGYGASIQCIYLNAFWIINVTMWFTHTEGNNQGEITLILFRIFREIGALRQNRCPAYYFFWCRTDSEWDTCCLFRKIQAFSMISTRILLML